MADFFRKPAGLIAVCLASLLATGAARAQDRNVPVLRKGEGGIRPTGRTAPVPEDAVTGVRSFDFDRPSLRGLKRTREASSRRMLQGPAAPADIWNVALVRVSFRTDRSGRLTSIETGGDFDFTQGGTEVIDPTPHDKAYFNSHMEAMARYWEFQSCGAAEVVWDVLPAGDEGSYKLSDLADYGPGSGGTWTTEMLVKFVQDAIIACDDSLRADGYPVRLSDYDAIVLAHAGANLQSDVDRDSPNDVPSFYARLGDGDEIVIEGGHVITELSVIPETSQQDGYTGGIAAVLAHEFGHQLGLPDLYDTWTNGPSVGVFDNMDSGGQLGAVLEDVDGELYYAEGFIPGGLCAWSRYFLGWMQADTLRTFDPDLALRASGYCPSRAVRVEMSADEYWLIENRAAELDGLYTGFVTDEATGVILGTANCLNCEPSFPAEIQWGDFVNGYDYLLPTEDLYPSPQWGPGLLVWHVDEYFIERRWENNEVNSRWPFGVALIEANGVVDLGTSSRYGLGWYDDAFYEGNATGMDDSTLPPAWSNWQVPTGLYLENVSARDTLMTFGAGCEGRMISRDIPGGLVPSVYGVLPLVGYDNSLIIDEEGKGWIPGNPSPVFDTGGPAMTPAARAFPMGGCAGSILGAVIVAEPGGTIHAFNGMDWTECPSWPVVLDTLAAFPVPAVTPHGTYVIAAEKDGDLHMIDADGQETGTPVSPPSGHSFTGNLVLEKNDIDQATAVLCLVECTGEGCGYPRLLRYEIEEGGLSTVENVTSDIPLSWSGLSGGVFLSGGDILPDRPGSEVWVTARGSGEVFLCGSGGLISGRKENSSIPFPPAVQDMNGDGRLDLVYTDGSRIFAIDASGANLTGWPRDLNNGVYYLPVKVTVTAPPVTASNGEGAWVIAVTDAGIIYMFDYEGELVTGWPRKGAGTFIEPVDLASSGYLSWLDIVYNDPASGFGAYRPESGRARWIETPFEEYRGSWTSVYGGPDRDSFILPSSGFDIPQPDWAGLEQNLVIYPNPSDGSRVAFNFRAPDNGEARLDIMTIEGQKVIERAMGLSGGQAEFTVDMTGQAAGIYLCRLVVSSGGTTVETKRKFAIVN